jgi:hypothetical protein
MCRYWLLYHSQAALIASRPWVEGIVSGLKESLGQILAVEGVRTAAVIDIATGMVVRSAGAEDASFAAAAADIADEAKMVRAALGPQHPGGDLDEFSMVTTSRLHVSKILDSRLGEGLLLFVDLDRGQANIALASLRVGQVAPAVLA